MSKLRETKRRYRHERVRKKIMGTSERPRLCIHRSLRGLQAHIVDDSIGKVLLGISTLDKDLKGKIKNGGNVQAANLLGEALAKKAVAKGVSKVNFDRGGYLFHGRIKAFAEAARKGGLKF